MLKLDTIVFLILLSSFFARFLINYEIFYYHLLMVSSDNSYDN